MSDVFKEVCFHVFVLELDKVSKHVVWREGVGQHREEGDELVSHSLQERAAMMIIYNRINQTY